MSEKKSIYIHIPFCVKKCVYCDFYSETHLSVIPEFVKTLLHEIELRTDFEKEAKPQIDTIYFGGGTPSLLKVDQIETILQTLGKSFDITTDAEITLEVNPGTIDADYLNDLKRGGINRLSIGVQSFNTQKLSFLKRIHTVEQSFLAIESAQNAGFENISVDLIYGLPFEDEDMWCRDLEAAIGMMPQHMSCYMLTIESGTPLGEMVEKKKILPSDSNKLARLFEKTVTVLGASGYEHYEISNFSKGKHHRSQHNSKYWQMTPYLGFGPAAHSHEADARFWNVPDINAYIKTIGSGTLAVQETETLTREQKMLEMIMLGLRTKEGIDMQGFKTAFGISFDHLFDLLITQVCGENLAILRPDKFFLSLEGKIRIDSIVEAFAQKIL